MFSFVSVEENELFDFRGIRLDWFRLQVGISEQSILKFYLPVPFTSDWLTHFPCCGFYFVNHFEVLSRYD